MSIQDDRFTWAEYAYQLDSEGNLSGGNWTWTDTKTFAPRPTVYGDVLPSDPAAWNSDTTLNIGNTAYGEVTIDIDYDVYTKNCVLGNEAAGDGVATVTGIGSTCNVGLDLLVGGYGSGELNIADGGVVDVARYAIVARRDGSSGEVYVSGGGSTLDIASGFNVGMDGGQGSLSVTNGGTVSSGGSLGIGDGAATSSGTVVVSGTGSTVTLASGFNAATVGEASLSITGGATMTAGGTCNVGRDSGGDGSLEVSGSGSALTLTSGNLYAGNSGTGAIDVSDGGTLSLSGFLAFGYSAGGDGTLLVSNGGKVSTTNNVFLGYNGSGMAHVSNGGELSAVNMIIGRYSGSDGELLISGGGVVNASGYVTVAEDMATTPASNGTVTVTGAGSQFNIVGEFQVGRKGTAEMNVLNGGKVTADYRCIIGGYAGGSAVVTVSGEGSEWRMDDALVFNQGVGELTISNGGLVQVSGAVTIGNNDFLKMGNDGMLAMAGIDRGFTLEDWIYDVGNFTGLQWWNEDHWDPMYDIGSHILNIPEEEYSFIYHSDGDFAGYTVLTVGTSVSPDDCIPGDANKDGTVDGTDAAILANHWQTMTGATWAMGDFNGDGKVNDIDATMMAANWQNSSSTSVPEPGTLALLGAGGLALMFLGIGINLRFAGIAQRMDKVLDLRTH